jgi:hypothetical protein
MSPFSATPSGSIGIPSVDALPNLSPPDSIPMTIEPLLDDESPKRAPARPPGPRPIPRRAPGTSTPDPPDGDKERSTPKPAPRLAPGLLGRLFGPPPPPSPERTRGSASRGDSRPDPESETRAEVVAKRRIERQIRETLGDRVRYFEVRITGRNAVIVAQPSRFWLRRSVRRSLETLPSLEGYRARIEIKD